MYVHVNATVCIYVSIGIIIIVLVYVKIYVYICTHIAYNNPYRYTPYFCIILVYLYNVYFYI